VPTWDSAAVVRSSGGSVSVPGALADFGPDFREASCCPRSSNNRAGSVRLSIWCSPGNTSQDTTADGHWKALDLLIEPAKIAAGPAPHLTAPGRGPQTAVWEIVWSTDTVRPLREAAERWLAKANEPISFRHNSLRDRPPAPQPQLLHLYEQCLPRGSGCQRCEPASPIVLFGDRRIAGTT
jgi:hypothetical protein